MNITLKNFVILLGSLLLTCGALSYAMKENEPSPAGQLAAKNVKERDSQFNALPLKIFHYFLECFNMSDLAAKNIKESGLHLNELPFDVFHYMTKFLNTADFLHLMQTNTYFNDKLPVLLFKKIKSAACQGCWKVPVWYNIDENDLFNRASPMVHFFNVVSRSDLAMLIVAIYKENADDQNKDKYLEDKKFSLAIAMHNKFTEGVTRLQEAFNITTEDCQELVGNMKFPLTENLLIAAIHLISPLELKELLNGQDAKFDPSLNDDAILKALVYAVHHRKMDHAEVLLKSQYVEPYFSPENYYRLRPYIDYSCENFDDASFTEFVIKKQPENILAFVDMFCSLPKAYQRPDALLKLYAFAPKLFHSVVSRHLFKRFYQFWLKNFLSYYKIVV